MTYEFRLPDIGEGVVEGEVVRWLVQEGDVVAEDQLSVADRSERGSYAGCIAGALSRQEFLDGLAAVGFVDAEVGFTHEVAPQLHAALIQAVKPSVGVR